MMAHERGLETAVVCLTEGSAGSHRGGARTDEDLGRLRRQEFAAALSVLGVDHGEVLNYPDGRLAQQNFSEIVGRLVERIRRFRPQVVLTFGADGSVNRHPDHTIVSCAATTAFHWAGRENFFPEQIAAGIAPFTPQKLYHSATGFLFNATAEEARRIPLVPASLVHELGQLRSRKFEAFSQHKTQAPILERVRAEFDRVAGVESFLLAASRAMPSSPPETGMFDGIEEE